VQRASVALLGRRVGFDEERFLVDLLRGADQASPGAGRRAVVDALAQRDGGREFVGRWSDLLVDFFRVPRVDEGELFSRKCYGEALQDEAPDLAALVRDTPPSTQAPSTFTVRDLIASSLRLDDLSPVAVAQSLAMLNRSFVGANADPVALELARRASFGSWFSGVYLRRDVVCLACHNGEFSVTASQDPAKNHHFPARTDLERSVFGDPTGPLPLGGFDGAARIAAPFRYQGFVFSALTAPASAVRPWGWAPECGIFASPGQIAPSIAPVDAALGGASGVDATGWDVAASLQRGFQGLRAHGLAPAAPGQAADPDQALAYLASLSLVEAVWTEITGGRLTVAHSFPRNAEARELLASLTEAFLSEKASLRSLLVRIVEHPIFNPKNPSEGCGELPAPWPLLLDPWTAANQDPGLRGNGPGDLVAPIPARALARGAYTALGWGALPGARPLFFPAAQDGDERAFLGDIGAFQKNSEPGFRGFDTQAALAWELRFGRCLRPDAVPPPDSIDRVAAAALAAPGATLGDAVVAVKDRLTGERQIDPGDERTLLEILVDRPLATPASSLSPDELTGALRLVCGVLLASPQFRLGGLDLPSGPAPLLRAFPEDAYDARCKALDGLPVAGLKVQCQPGKVSLAP